MEISYITDTDFILQKIEGDEYSLIYGIIQHSIHSYELRDKYIYNLTAVLCLKQDTTVLRIVKTKQWLKLLEDIIKRLSMMYESNVLITIPFCNIYAFKISELITSYELSFNILNEFLKANFSNVEVIDSIKKCYPIQALQDLFLNLAIEVENGVFDVPSESLYIDSGIVYDEMIRRGIDAGLNISKSEMFDQNLYYRTLINSVKPKALVVELEEESNGDKVEIVHGRISDIKKIGVIYYMLKDCLKDNQELIVKVANYVLNKEYDIENKAGNSAYKYVHSPSLFINKLDKTNYIKEQLRRYNIDIPKDLSD